MYDFTFGLAAFPPARPGQRPFLAAVAADQQETDRFLGAFAGIVPPEEYFNLGTVVRILGPRAIRLAGAGLDVLRRSSWSSRGTDRRDHCPTVDV